jgi:hypothetical protein
MMLGFDSSNVNQSIAAFLVTRWVIDPYVCVKHYFVSSYSTVFVPAHRPPYAYIGFGWESDDRNWNDAFYLQTGEPTELCVEAPSGVFSRDWTMGTATLNCNDWTASLPFPSL